MKSSDEQTPIRERWTARPTGPDDEASAGALLRSAAEHGPVEEKRLAEIHAHLRASRRSRSFARPAPRLLRQLAFAAGFVLCGGVLSASVMHVMRRPPKAPEVAPAPTVESQKKPLRRTPGRRAPGETMSPLQAPEAPAPDPTPQVQPTPSAAPEPPARTEVPASATGPRLPSPHRRVASREWPGAAPIALPGERPTPSVVAASPSRNPSEPNAWLAPPEMPSPPLPRAPVERPVPTAVEQPVPTVPPSPALPAPAQPSRLARESRWLASAIAKLRQEGQPEAALAILDQHQSELSAGPLAPEANATRIEALLRLGRNGQALVLLDGQRLSAHGLGREMLVARAELRAEKGRTSAAIHDFDLILSAPSQADGITERALYGRATCRAKSGDRDGAHGDLTQYLNAFPQGRFAQDARSALSAPLR